jgi:hypothetical protein
MNREELLQRQAAGETLSQEELDFLEQTSSNEPASQSPSTPPTPSPTAPAIDPKDQYISVLEATLRENNRQLQEAATRASAPPPPPAPTTEELKQNFYNDPVNTTRSIVEEALAKTIAPLNDFVRGLRGVEGSPYDRMLSKFKADPRFAPALNDPQILAAVQQIMDATELTEINMQSAIVHANGLKSMGLMGPPTHTPAPTPTPASTPAPSPTPAPSTVLPPHVRPSGPPAPRNDGGNGKPARRQLTENERLVMRQNGFKTEEEYWTWLEMPANEVAAYTGDKPKAK